MELCESDCKAALSLQPTKVKGILHRALCREYFEKFEEALKDFKKVRELSPTSRLAKEGCERLQKVLVMQSET